MFSQKKPEKHHINENFEQEWQIISGKAPHKRTNFEQHEPVEDRVRKVL